MIWPIGLAPFRESDKTQNKQSAMEHAFNRCSRFQTHVSLIPHQIHCISSRVKSSRSLQLCCVSRMLECWYQYGIESVPIPIPGILPRIGIRIPLEVLLSALKLFLELVLRFNQFQHLAFQCLQHRTRGVSGVFMGSSY